MSYQYHAMSNFFNRDNVGLQGFATFYRVSSLEERAHAQQLMDYQVKEAYTPHWTPGWAKFAHILLSLWVSARV